jgi:putative transposase
MSQIARFVIWICSKFTKKEIEQIVAGLIEVLQNRNPEVKPKDDFQEKHPHYRDFSVDPLAPLTEPQHGKKEPTPCQDWQTLLADYQKKHGKPLTPVKYRTSSLRVPEHIRCPNCDAPHDYVYYNDGKKRSQLLCKVCSSLFQTHKRSQRKTKYYCPYCHHALFQWKQKKEVTLYKCCNDQCLHRARQIEKLNGREKTLRIKRSSQFKLCYQYREYHYQPHQLTPTGPQPPTVNLARIHNGTHILSLILTFYVSFALSARKTALVLRSVFCIPISYQTVLNYAAAAAFSCHNFNRQYKGPIDDISAGDEAYIKVMGKYHYVFFFISSQRLKITAYHTANNRETLPAIIAMTEAIRTAHPNQALTLVTDANPSYPAGIHFLNAHREKDLIHRKVIGLQNLDNESAAYRPFKQLLERLNRTFKHHVKPSHGFNSVNGAIALTTLFVTHYNFLRPHMSLQWQVPIPLSHLEGIATIQGKWAKILSLAA